MLSVEASVPHEAAEGSLLYFGLSSVLLWWLERLDDLGGLGPCSVCTSFGIRLDAKGESVLLFCPDHCLEGRLFLLSRAPGGDNGDASP